MSENPDHLEPDEFLRLIKRALHNKSGEVYTLDKFIVDENLEEIFNQAEES